MSTELLKKLLDAGTPTELVAEVAMLLGDVKALERRRASDRERQYNRRHVTSRDTADVADVQDKGSLEVPPKVSPAPLPNPLPKPSKTIPLNPPFVDRFKGEWNDMAKSLDLPLVEQIRGKRLSALLARIDEHGEEAVSNVIAAVPNSPHWRGENGWRGNFDSLMRPDNFQRMKEGAYAASQRAPPAKPKYVSKTGYEYRGTEEQVMREAQRRGDNDTYWQVQVDMRRRREATSIGDLVKGATA